MAAKSYRITAPLLTDEERAQAVTAGGLSGGEESSDTVRGMLIGLQHQSHIYAGTVDPVTIAERRARNKRARKARRLNRRAR